jgi:murein DD-endopeptidase MepM/ murein hydrolase activator NlpD
MKRAPYFLLVILVLAASIVSAQEGVPSDALKRWEERPTPDPSLPTPTPAPTATPVPLSASYPVLVDPWLTADKPYNTGACPELLGWGWRLPLLFPVEGTIYPNRQFKFSHRAIDIAAPFQSPVYAAAAGVVIWAGFHLNGFGRMVILAHGNGWQTLYAHLDTVAVDCGQFVARGSQIGTTGRTGGTTFDHLHFEVRNGRHSYNPVAYLP